MILTVTTNPAYDVTYLVDKLERGRVHRVQSVRERPGGKGINVARVLRQLGEQPVALGFADRAFAAAVRTSGLDADLVLALPSVRRTLVVAESGGGETTSLWEPGPVAPVEAAAELLRRVSARIGSAAGVVVSGSLPRGTAPDLPAEIARIATAAGVPVICDLDGEALVAAVDVPGVILVPNADELHRLSDTAITSPVDVVRAAARLISIGVRAVIATRGVDGMIAVSADGAWSAALEHPLAGNPTGAGDAAAAAIIANLAGATRIDWPALLRDAVATSAAAVVRPVAGEFDAAIRSDLLTNVQVEHLGAI